MYFVAIDNFQFQESFIKNLIVLVGPTAVGKTTFAIRLAQHFHTEIVSADSRQFFREINIGTAKPSPAELMTVKHHLVNSLSIHDDYSAGKFETDALECILKIFDQHDYAILCGGSGLYVDLVCKGSDDLPPSDMTLRAGLNALLVEKGIGALQEKLRSLDPEFYDQIDLKNPHRIIRAIEVCMLSGRKYSELRTARKNKRPFGVIRIGIETDRKKVYALIDERVDRMMENNLLGEAKSLYPFRHLNALRTVGYSELFRFLDGNFTLDEAVSQIKQHTRNFAKRQWTWFKKDVETKWFGPEDTEAVLEHIASRNSE